MSRLAENAPPNAASGMLRSVRAPAHLRLVGWLRLRLGCSTADKRRRFAWAPPRPLVWLLLLGAGLAAGASPVDVYDFPDAATEARYRALVAELRCPKCLNTNLAGSDAPIAQDLRAAVHRLIVREGLADQQVRDYLQARYGDFILYDPPVQRSTLLLWAGPILFAGVGLGLIAWRMRRQQRAQLSEEERMRLQRILDDA